MKKIFLTLTIVLNLTPLISTAYEGPKTLCSVNNSRLFELSCSGEWAEVPSYPEVSIKMKKCFGYKSTERLSVEIDQETKVYNSVIFPFSVRQAGYSIKCNRSDQDSTSGLNVF